MDIPASWATSWRRSPGVRRLPTSGSPASRVDNRARLARRNTASSSLFNVLMYLPCRTPAPAGWYRESQAPLASPASRAVNIA